MRETLSTTRRKVLLGGTAAISGALVGCARNGDQFSESDALLTHERWGKGETALTYRTSDFYTPIEAESSQPAAAPALNQQHQAWAETHPDYRIAVEYPAFGQWKDDLVLDASQGSPPDGSTIDSSWVADFYEYLQPLNDYVDDVDDFFPFVREATIQDGEQIGRASCRERVCLYV